MLTSSFFLIVSRAVCFAAFSYKMETVMSEMAYIGSKQWHRKKNETYSIMVFLADLCLDGGRCHVDVLVLFDSVSSGLL